MKLLQDELHAACTVDADKGDLETESARACRNTATSSLQPHRNGLVTCAPIKLWWWRLISAPIMMHETVAPEPVACTVFVACSMANRSKQKHFSGEEREKHSRKLSVTRSLGRLRSDTFYMPVAKCASGPLWERSNLGPPDEIGSIERTHKL